MSETKSTGSLADVVKKAIKGMGEGLTALRKLDGSNGSDEQRRVVDELFNQVLVGLKKADLPKEESNPLQEGIKHLSGAGEDKAMTDPSNQQSGPSLDEIKSNLAKDDVQVDKQPEIAPGEAEVTTSPGNAN